MGRCAALRLAPHSFNVGITKNTGTNQKMETINWISKFHLPELNDGWVIGFTSSTVPMENWFYKRNRLKDDSIKIELNVPESGQWVATLERHDKLFQVQWRPNNDLRVESQQLKYKKIIKWPELLNLSDFPLLIEKIESILNVEFIPHIDISARMIDTGILIENKHIKQWLSPCAESLGHLRE